MEENTADVNAITDDGESTTETVENQEEETQPDELEKKNKQLFERTKKAEAEAKELRAELAELAKAKEKKTDSKSEYSLQDIRALADVHDDNVDSVVRYAKLENISIPEAKKSTIIQTILREADEQRKTALAANTGAVKRGSSKGSDEAILEQFANGNLPETDEGMARLAEARMNQKLKK